ncbi:MAG: preprotein translocase subunit SecG [Paludibacteraceae bacterium]
MYIFLTILIVIAAILLTFFVLVQNSKGGGLASSFASANQVMGAPKTADFLEKASWGLIAFIVVLSVGAVWVSKSDQSVDPSESAIKEQVQQAAEQMAPVAAPAADFEEELPEAE